MKLTDLFDGAQRRGPQAPGAAGRRTSPDPWNGRGVPGGDAALGDRRPRSAPRRLSRAIPRGGRRRARAHLQPAARAWRRPAPSTSRHAIGGYTTALNASQGRRRLAAACRSAGDPWSACSPRGAPAGGARYAGPLGQPPLTRTLTWTLTWIRPRGFRVLRGGDRLVQSRGPRPHAMGYPVSALNRVRRDYLRPPRWPAAWSSTAARSSASPPGQGARARARARRWAPSRGVRPEDAGEVVAQRRRAPSPSLRQRHRRLRLPDAVADGGGLFGLRAPAPRPLRGARHRRL